MWRTVLAISGGVLGCLALAWWTPTRSCSADATKPNDDRAYAQQRMEMIREIEADVVATRHYTGIARLDPRVKDALLKVPRHEFVPAELRHRAYDNRPQPIGDGQTISQPYIVALMTDLLKLDDHDVVLEVGTGSAYQAAVLAELAGRVYTIEIIESLGRSAAARLERLGYDNVEVRIGDGYRGWPEHAPYDAVIVTAAADEIPPPLIDQLKAGGRLVVPVATSPMAEQLMLLTKAKNGEIQTREILPVRFVPLTGDH